MQRGFWIGSDSILELASLFFERIYNARLFFTEFEEFGFCVQIHFLSSLASFFQLLEMAFHPVEDSFLFVDISIQGPQFLERIRIQPKNDSGGVSSLDPILFARKIPEQIASPPRISPLPCSTEMSLPDTSLECKTASSITMDPPA